MREERPESNPRATVIRRRSEPQRAWVCGYAELGQCCAAGPTAKGLCGRAEQGQNGQNGQHGSQGQRDEQGQRRTPELPPCVPRRSHWHQRRSLRMNLAVLTGGILLLLMSLPSREKHFVPGELSRKHAQILENTLVSQRCGLCHPGSHAGSDIAWSLLSTLASSAGRQDALCMQCHQGHMPTAGAGLPHDLSPVSDGAPERATEATHCATCHIEHHGRSFDLKAMSDDRCQACHRRKFESFSSGHPDFANYPPERARELAFSHQQHADKHFPQKNRQFDCRQCHLDANGTASSGQVSRSVAFETGCAECHSQPIEAAISGGWALLELPSIEASAAESEAGLENWPRAARFGFEGTISPVLRALLAADSNALTALKKLPASGRLSELSTFDGARHEVTSALARAIAQLIDDTARDGQAAWRSRLAAVTQTKLGPALTASDQRLIEAMIAGLPPDLFRKIQSQWFSSETTLADNRPQVRLTATHNGGGESLLADDSLLGEASIAPEDDDLALIAPLAAGDAPLASASSSSSSNTEASPFKGATHVSSGGWYLDEPTLALKYMPTGHADQTLAAWTLWWKRIEAAGRSQPPVSAAAQIPGGCVACHRLPSPASAAAAHAWTLANAWKVAQQDPNHKEFTKFNHAPHLSLPAVSDCKYCHVLSGGSAARVAGIDAARRRVAGISAAAGGLVASNSHAHLHDGEQQPPHVGASEFEKLQLSQCVACHRPNGANAGCLQCHNYHITSPPETSLFTTSLPVTSRPTTSMPTASMSTASMSGTSQR